jgi:hypothetical protein
VIETPQEVKSDGVRAGAAIIAEAAALSNEEIVGRLDELFRQKAAVEGAIVVLLGEVGRRQAFRDEGATAAEPWAVERFGVSTPTARAYAHVGERAWDIPHLVEALCSGELSFDKVRAVANAATPETDRQLRDQARESSVRQLVDVAAALNPPPARPEYDRRYLRFNDRLRTMSVQLPAVAYAEARSCLEARGRAVPSDGETTWDQRLCDAFVELIRSSASDGPARSANPFFVVVHVPVAALLEESGEQSALAGELERDGLISVETVRQIVCDATIAIGVDDDVGHTMYEGRARREPTAAQRREVMRRDRHCRFPGCANVTFTNTHHVVPWKPGGRTDLQNLALMCLHHHHLVHSKGWTMTGNANEELTFVGPSGRAMTTRPSPRWTNVTAGPRSGVTSS